MATRVLVVGGGFAGLAALNHLVRARKHGVSLDLHLIDRDLCHTFAPALPDLISARLSPEHLQYNLREHCDRHSVHFTRAAVNELQTARRAVSTDGGEFEADFIILAAGCRQNYFGDEVSRENALGLKTLESAQEIHRRMTRKVDLLIRGEPAGATVVVGGGYTGYEAASHAAYYLHRRAGFGYRQLAELCPTYIVEVADATLRNCERPVRRWCRRAIGRLGVDIRTGVSVDSYQQDAVRLTDGTRLPGATVIWTAGFRPVDFLAELDVPRGAGNRLAVNDCLQLPQAPCVFAAGDCAAATPAGSDQPLRMAVQFSLSGGKLAAENVLRSVHGRPLKSYDPADLGYVVPLGSGHGAGIILGQMAWGKLPSWLHYFMCSLRSWNWKNRLGIARDYLTGGATK